MTALTYNLSAAMEGGSSFEVTADQRDIAKWEIEPFGCPVTAADSRSYTFTRYLAFSAGRRKGTHALTWAEFGEQCINVEVLGDEPADAADPGSPAASAGS